MIGRRDLHGSVVVLVGASSGVGRASALAFADHGAKLVLTARSEEVLEELAEDCRSRGAQAIVVATDVVEPGAMDALAVQAREHFGRIDVWVHAASMLVAGDLEDHPADEAHRLIETNVSGCVDGARAALRVFREQDRGTLVVVSSLLGRFPNPVAPVYVASKFATRGLALSLRHAVANERDIHVCSLLPGPIDTPMFGHAANRTGKELRPIPPAYAPERVAAAIVARARHPRRESTAGLANRALLVGHRIAPRLTEWMVARWSGYFITREKPASADSGTLFSAPEDAAAHGGYRRGRIRQLAGEALGGWLARRGAS